MTSYSPSYTGRYRAHYKVAQIKHTIQFRKQLGASPTAVALLAGVAHDVFATWAADLCSDFVWLSAEQADEGSDIFYPSTLPVAVTATGDSPVAYTPFQKITHTRFSCRAAGSKGGFELYGIKWLYGAAGDDLNVVAYDGLLTSAEDARIATTIGFLNTQCFANSGNPSSAWNPSATVKVNDYWLRQLRKGAVS